MFIKEDICVDKKSLVNSTVAIFTLFAIINYHWPICWMICFIQFVRQSFPYWLSQRVIPYTYFRLRAHSGCGWSAEDAYSSYAPGPTFVYVRGLCCLTLDFVIAFWIMIVLHIGNFAILYVTYYTVY